MTRIMKAWPVPMMRRDRWRSCTGSRQRSTTGDHRNFTVQGSMKSDTRPIMSSARPCSRMMAGTPWNIIAPTVLCTA